jgi:hypothetical protein
LHQATQYQSSQDVGFVLGDKSNIGYGSNNRTQTYLNALAILKARLDTD